MADSVRPASLRHAAAALHPIPATRLLSLFYRLLPAPAAPSPERIGRVAVGMIATVGLLAGPYPAATVRGLDRRREPLQARSMDDDQPLPELPDD